MFVCFLWKNKCALNLGSLFDLLSPWFFFLFSPRWRVLLHLAAPFPSPQAALCSAPRYMDINELCWSCGVQQTQFSPAVNLLYGHFLSLAAECGCCVRELGLRVHSEAGLPNILQGLRGGLSYPFRSDQVNHGSVTSACPGTQTTRPSPITSLMRGLVGGECAESLQVDLISI